METLSELTMVKYASESYLQVLYIQALRYGKILVIDYARICDSRMKVLANAHEYPTVRLIAE